MPAFAPHIAPRWRARHKASGFGKRGGTDQSDRRTDPGIRRDDAPKRSISEPSIVCPILPIRRPGDVGVRGRAVEQRRRWARPMEAVTRSAPTGSGDGCNSEKFFGPLAQQTPQHRCTQRNWRNSSTRIPDTVNWDAHHPADELCSCAQCFVAHGERCKPADHGSREGPVGRHAESECHWFKGSPAQWPWSFRTVPPPAAASAAASASSVVGPQRPK